MKVLLINPPISMTEERLPLFNAAPLGLGYIAAVLEKNNVDVKIIDGYIKGLNKERLENELETYSPDIVGISVVTPRAKQGLEISRIVKEKKADIYTVLGGPHVTALSDEVIKLKEVDIAVIGEGDFTMLDLVNAIADNRDLRPVAGIKFKKDGEVIETESRPLISDLDQIPHPAFHLLPIREYNPYPSNSKGPPENFANITTSRGCPHKCTYCDVKLTFGRAFRVHSPEYVIEEIEHLYHNYNVRNIYFRDSIFNLKKERIKELCALILKKGLDISWECNGRVNYVDEDLLRTMKAAGCWQIQYGVESGNQEILNKAARNTTIQQIKDAFKLTKKVGLEGHGYFMIGLPGETKETIKETIKLANSISADIVGFTIAVPFPGSEFYDWAVKNDYLKIEDWNSFIFNTPIVETPELSRQDILDAQKRALRSYYLRPKQIIKQIMKLRTWEELKKNIGYMKLLLFKFKNIYDG